MSDGVPFIWYELMTSDPDGSAAFYANVIGWSIQSGDPGATGGLDYRHIQRSDGGSAGGMLGLTPEMTAGGARSCWLPYLHVVDVDKAASAICADGGTMLMPKMTIPVGELALVADPQGIPIYIMAPIMPEGMEGQQSDVFSPDTPQHVRWNELASPDQAASLAFYEKHFGIVSTDSMPMGELGDYCFIRKGDVVLGAIMPKPQPETPPLWQMYFGVPSIAEARLAVEAHGGTILMGPHEVPGGDWVLVCIDPQGVPFGLVGPKGD